MRILVVDDDRAVRESLRRSLAFNGYQVDLAGDGKDGAGSRAWPRRPDAMVLDVMMPRLDGLEVCRRMREAGDDLPILVLTARDAVVGPGRRARRGRRRLPAQALRARGAAGPAARAAAPPDPSTIAAASEGTVLEFADLTLDPDTRDVRRGDRSISLTRTEFSLLELLLAHPRRVLTRAQILEQVWGYDFPTTGNALEVYVGYLRRKTEAGRRAAADPHRARRRLRPARLAPVTTAPVIREAAAAGSSTTSRCAPGSGSSPPWPPRVR